MHYDAGHSLEILSRTPKVLRAWLAGVSDDWVLANYGAETFSPFDVLGHLIHGEHADWIARTHWILQKGAREPFPLFDRFAQERASAGKALASLLDEFEQLRAQNLRELRALELDERQLDLLGQHPTLGAVTLRQHLATWVVHDLDHIAQIARALSFQYKDEVGPWREFLPILPRD